MKSNSYNMVHAIVCERMSHQEKIYKREIKPNMRQSKSIMESSIVDVVVSVLGVSFDEIKSKCRESRLMIPRQLYCYLMYKHAGATTIRIGKILDRDHTTIVHSVRRVQDMLYVKDDEYTKAYESVIKSLNP